MAASDRDPDPPRPGPLRLRAPVRAALYALRHLTQTSLHALTPPRVLPPAALDVSLVAAVEEALRCTLPDEVLACLANGDHELDEFGFRLDRVADHTRLAHRRGCPKDLVAVGLHPDFHAFYCVPRTGGRDRGVRLADRDNFDGSVTWYDLGDWLAGKARGRQEFLAESYPALATWRPTAAEVAAFSPNLVG